MSAGDPQDGKAESHLPDRLQGSLGSAYTLERELGGGGMSRVFVARENALGRTVVVKLLHPDLGMELSAERFRREIALLARLQHPCIVPLLAAGEADGLPYYTMPFVDGDTLRARLERAEGGRLPVRETIGILRDVARAIAYAHELGIVHRDIKPENVLLSRDMAMVTDFGIARAVLAARTQVTGTGEPGLLTATGISLGTPTYMAPEQAAGGTVDHRADLYALGALGYELLTGAPPFRGLPAQQFLAALMTQEPEPVRAVRPDTPEPLAAVVMQCLSKDPVGRPESAEAVLRALNAADHAAVASTGSTGTPGRWPRPGGRAAAIAGALALALLAAAFLLTRAGAPGSLLAAGALRDQDRIVVTDFYHPQADTTMADMAAEAVRTELSQSGLVHVMPPTEVAAALGRMERPPGTRLDLQLAQEIAQREGAKAIVDGDIRVLGDGYVVSIRMVAADSVGTELAAFREVADGPRELLATLERLSRRLRSRMGESLRSVRATPPLERVTTASLPALQRYTAARRANLLGDYRAAVEHARAAVGHDSLFAYAQHVLAVGMYNSRQAGPERDSASVRAFRYRSRVAARDEPFIRAAYYAWGPGRDRSAAVRALEDAIRLDSTNVSAVNNLAVLLEERREFSRAVELLRGIPDPLPISRQNLSRLLYAVGDRAAGDRALEELARRHPTSPFVDNSRVTQALAWEWMDSIPARLETLRRSTASQFRVNATLYAASFALLHGRIAEAERLAAEADRLNVDQGTAPAIPARVRYSVIADGWLRGRPEVAAARLDSLLPRMGLDTLSALNGRLLLARLYAQLERPDRARELLAQYDARATDSSLARWERPYRQWTEGFIALAEGRWLQAADLLRRGDSRADGPVDACAPCMLPPLGLAYDRAGMADSAIVIYTRYLEMRYTYRLVSPDLDPRYRAPMHKRLGELFEARGDYAAAREHYARFLEWWKDADPELRSHVLEVRQRLARLERRRG
jgi:tetratricopeptide (TPR) repeat protein